MSTIPEGVSVRSQIGPFTILPNWVVPLLDPGQLRVYIALSQMADGRHRAWPSHATIAERVGLKERQVRNLLTALQDKGCVTWVHRPGAGSGRGTNVYTVVQVDPRQPAMDCHMPTGNRQSSDRQPAIQRQATGNGLPTELDPEELDPEELENNLVELGLVDQPNRAVAKASPKGDRVSVKTVFDFWITHTERTTRTILDGSRRGVISRAIGLGYPLEDLLDAIRGMWADPWHRGHNDRDKPYTDLRHALGNAELIEKFRDAWRNPPLTKPNPAPKMRESSADKIARAMGLDTRPTFIDVRETA